MSITKRILAALAVGFALVAAQGAAPPAAECVYCPKFRCYGSGVCMSCTCMRTDNSGGQCVSLEALPPGAELIR